MSFASASSIALRGTTGHLIDVQVDVSTGVVGTSMIGRLDGALH